MKKIFPIRNTEHDTWFNYSNYLNWTYKKIEDWENYLKFFSPDFKILNESIEVLRIIPKTEIDTIKEEVAEPAWKYTITDEDDETEEVYCYFPSELNFREGYLNTHPNSYLCYFAPPDAFSEQPLSNIVVNGEVQWRRTQTVSRTSWENLLAEGKIDTFPISRLVISNSWRHSGVQHVAHPDGFKKENYIFIAKPSSSWYVPKTLLHSFSFYFYKNAMDVVGSIVPFVVELKPSRYILHPSKERWLRSFKTMSLYAATWSGSTNNFIFFKEANGNCLWTGSYPLMHELLINEADTNDYEDFITDNIFTTETRNIDNHTTAVYNINTMYSTEETDTTLWKSIYISLC